MIILLLLSAILVNESYATANCLELHKQQLASLNERMNQMLSTLYSSPVLSKLLSSANLPKSSSLFADNEDPPSQDKSCYSTPPSSPAPNIICVSPSQPTSPAILPMTSSTPSFYYPQVASRPSDYTYPGYNPWSHYYDPYNNPYAQYRQSLYPPNPYPYQPPPYDYNYPQKVDYAPPVYPYNSLYAPPNPFYPPPYIPPPTPYYPVSSYPETW